MKIRYILLCLLLVGCKGRELDTISKNIGVNVRDGEIIIFEDNHGWFNDGETYAKVHYNDDLLIIETTWEKLPLDNEISILNDKIPDVDKGYYYFESKHGNHNYILAIYDSESNQLYYIKSDS